MQIRSKSMFWLATACLVACVMSQDAQPPLYRLPNTVMPKSYSIRLQPNLDSGTVTGAVMITLVTNLQDEMLNNITLHLGPDSNVDNAGIILMDSMGSTVPLLSTKASSNGDTTLQVLLEDGTYLRNNHMYMLSLPFTSPLYSDPIGLYTGTFDGTSKYVATGFRGTFARYAFPCFDEPQYKTPVTLQVVRPADYTVYSTAKLYSSVMNSEGNFVDTFSPTPAISINSLGLFMSEGLAVYDSVSNINLIVPSSITTNTSSMAVWLQQIVSIFGDMPIPNPPINLVCLNDRQMIPASSMGFVFASAEVFQDLETIGEYNYQAVNGYLLSAFLQQYLAHAKTPAWWSDVWLTESIGAYIANQLLSQGSQSDLQMVQIRSKAFGGPVVNYNLNAQLDIETVLLNQSIRDKGVGVLNMWKDTLPDLVVDNTIKGYFDLNLPVTQTSDFMNLLEKNLESQTVLYNVTEVISMLLNWLTYDSNPTVTAIISNGSVVLSQTADCSNSDNKNLWPISISYTQSTSPNWTDFQQDMWLVEQSLTEDITAADWTVFDLENAPYRVHYDSSWSSILSALKTLDSGLPVTVIAALQDDALALALNGCLDWSTLLLILNETQHSEANWLPVTKAFKSLTALIGDNQHAMQEFQLYVTSLFSDNSLDQWDLTKAAIYTDQWFSRMQLTPWLCKFNIGTCQTAVKELGTQVLTGNLTGVDPNDIENVVCLGARYLNYSADTLLTNYMAVDFFRARLPFTLAMSCLTDSANVQIVLNAILNSSVSSSSVSATQVSLLPSDIKDIMVGLASNVENAPVLVDFIVENAEVLQTLIGSGYLSDVIKTLGQFSVNISKLQTLDDSKMNVGYYVIQSANQAVQQSTANIKWWSTIGQSFEIALPQLTTVAPPTTAQATTTNVPRTSVNPTTPTAKPSSASTLDIHLLSLTMLALLTAARNL